MIVDTSVRVISAAAWLLFYPVTFMASFLPFVRDWVPSRSRDTPEEKVLHEWDKLPNGALSSVLDQDADEKFTRYDTSRLGKQSLEMPVSAIVRHSMLTESP